jgi:hypothetical protein
MTARQNVTGPTQPVNTMGLFSAVDMRPVTDVHVLGGVTWSSRVPAVSSTTIDPCFIGNTVGALVKTTSQYFRGASPFTVYAEIDCSPPGFWDNMDAYIAEAFALSEQAAAEYTLMTGSVAATGGSQYPHLAAASQLIEASTNIMLQPATQVVTGVPLDIVEGLGRLEDMMMSSLNGPGVVHTTPASFEILASRILMKWNGGVPYTQAGNRIVMGVGYTDWSPSGAAPTPVGNTWLYGTGQLFGYRGPVVTFPDASTLRRDVNLAKMIAYRDYVLAFDGGPFGVEITLGGLVSGTYNSAT